MKMNLEQAITRFQQWKVGERIGEDEKEVIEIICDEYKKHLEATDMLIKLVDK